MKINFKKNDNCKICISFAFKGDGFSEAAKLQGFEADASQIAILSEGGKVNVLCGLGEKISINTDAFERAVAAAVKGAAAFKPTELAINLDGVDDADGEYAAHAGLAALMATYSFDNYKTAAKTKPALNDVFIDSAKGEVAFAPLAALYDGIALGRDLMNEPANILYPTEFASRLKELEALGVEITILDVEEMTKLGMGALLGVGQGATHESRVVMMNYKGGSDDAPLLALVGKGLCFDAGGISLKPSGGMEDMKGDMGGAAAVSGTLKTIATRKAKANVVGLVALSENMPDGNAMRPGDIVTSMSGKTIEVLNTDAEGRLVLCDTLTLAQTKFNPKYVIDLATLTGAIVVSLGHDYAGLFSNSDEFAANISAAGDTCGEKVWRMPMGASYDKLIDSKIADVKNVNRSGPGSPAGSITAAQFLKRFINEGVEWAHIDIAGTAWKSGNEDPREPNWATGYGVRLLDTLINQTFEK